MESATLTRPRAGASGRAARLRAVPASAWARLGLAALSVAVLVGFLVYPTFPNYDSYYSLLWAREALDLEQLSFDGYRTPTEHPLAILFALPLTLLGDGGDRVLVFFTLVSFVVLAAGLYRLARLSFGPLVGFIAAALLCTRFDFPFLAVRGYIDIPFLALVIWAAALELERPRRGLPVFALLTAAALLRPEAWVLIGAYWLWFAWRASWRDRVVYAGFAAIGPLAWSALDWIATGDPLFSLHHTSDSAEELGRARGLSAVPSATQQFLIRLDKLPVVLGGIAGLALAAWFAPRRTAMPLALLLSGVGTFVAVALAGLSVIQRYLLVPSIMVMVFCGVALGGWSMLRHGSRLRRAWAVGAAALVVFGMVFTVLRVSVAKLDSELRFRGDAHAALEAVLRDPAVRAGMRCGAVTVPTHKLVPDVRWIADLRAGRVVARSDPDASAQRGVALVVTGREALARQVFVDSSVDPLVNLPPDGYRRIATSEFYAAYVRC
jgi:Dolichyl-phosphate-mannose-protein mannosyltransferase